MDIKPLHTFEEIELLDKTTGEHNISEVSIKSIDALLQKAQSVQETLAEIPVADRIEALDNVGRIWQDNTASGKYDWLKQSLSKSTGYSKELIDIEFSLVPHVFAKDNILRNLSCSFSGGHEGLHKFVEVEDGEYYRYLPSGPIFIISSGNSVIPPLIPTTLSLVTGNLTILKPSISNHVGVVEVFKALHDISDNSKAAKALSDALIISYFTHDSKCLGHLLENAPLGVVNFWGADPARTEVGKKVASNPNHPTYLINGPLTGIAVIDEEKAAGAIKGLALNMVLYDQQLCSSPTQAVFVGSMEKATEFAAAVGMALDEISKDIPLRAPKGSQFTLQSARKMLLFKGSKIFSSKDKDNPWTIVVSRQKSALEDIMMSLPEFNIFNRRRFIEIIVVDELDLSIDIIKDVPKRMAFFGVDKVQTVGLSLSIDNEKRILQKLAHTGIYRVTQLEDMFVRRSAEPYDGINIASIFTYMVYYRNNAKPLM